MTTTTTKTTAPATTTDTLNHAEMVALVSAFKTAEITKLKAGLEPGTYQIDTLVHLFGTIEKEPSKEGIIAQRAFPWKLFAAALNRLNGVSVDAIVREAENVSAQEEKDLKATVQAALTEIKGDNVGTISGRTLTNLTAEKVSDEN